MEFLFVCPEKNEIFKSADFTIVENRGIKTDTAGNKVLDATVKLSRGCPYCGKKHTYPAHELACPFEPSKEKTVEKEQE